MKELSVYDIRNTVKGYLDELGQNDADFMRFDKDNAEIDTIIDNVILLSIRNVLLSAPHKLLDGISPQSMPTPVFVPNKLYGVVSMPNDFLRLVSFKMSDWSYPVTEAIAEDSSEYHMQQNEYMMGTPERPMCALIIKSNGKDMEFYSCRTNSATVSTLRYVSEPVFSGDERSVRTVQVCDLLVDAVLTQITGQVLLSLNESQRASIFLGLSAAYGESIKQQK